jgi:hypothetical protein
MQTEYRSVVGKFLFGYETIRNRSNPVREPRSIFQTLRRTLESNREIVGLLKGNRSSTSLTYRSRVNYASSAVSIAIMRTDAEVVSSVSGAIHTLRQGVNGVYASTHRVMSRCPARKGSINPCQCVSKKYFSEKCCQGIDWSLSSSTSKRGQYWSYFSFVKNQLCAERSNTDVR